VALPGHLIGAKWNFAGNEETEFASCARLRVRATK
jgi:hypothetical protein